MNFRINLNSNISEKFRASFKIAPSFSNRNKVSDGDHKGDGIVFTVSLFARKRYSNPNTNLPTANDVFYKGTNIAFVSHQETYSNVVFKARNVNQLKENLHHYGQKQTKKRFRTPIKMNSTPSILI
jgi:hypothetical protein